MPRGYGRVFAAPLHAFVLPGRVHHNAIKGMLHVRFCTVKIGQFSMSSMCASLVHRVNGRHLINSSISHLDYNVNLRLGGWLQDPELLCAVLASYGGSQPLLTISVLYANSADICLSRSGCLSKEHFRIKEAHL